MLQTLEELFQTALDHAEGILVGERGAQVAPVFWVQHDPGPGEMFIAPWDGEVEKVLTYAAIRSRLKNPRAHSYAFVSEAWMVEESLRRPSGLAPEEHPERREVVMIEAFKRHGEGGTRVYAIRRNRKGVVTALERLPRDDEGTGFRGRLHNLFRPEDDMLPGGLVRRGKSAGKPVTTHTALNYCLDCGKQIDAATPTPDSPDDSIPRPGDVAICLDCAHIMAYANDLSVRALTDDEVIEIAGDPDIVRAVNAIVEFKKASQG